MLILASNSSRRKKLLADIGLEFETITNDVSEEVEENLNPQQVVVTLSKRKAEAALKKRPNDIIIAADTAVYLEGELLGKPENEESAYQILKKLSGKLHKVYTGVTIMDSKQTVTFYEVTNVYMKPYNDLQIYDYIKTEEPFGKAGAYAIQGLGGQLVDYYEGDFFTVVGLPIKKVQVELKKFDYE